MIRFFCTFLFFIAGVFLFVSPMQAAESNQLIKGSMSAVYYLAEDGRRYVFPNEKIFFSWYEDFSTVITVSDEELASIPIGEAILYRAGTRLVKITTDPKVYAVGLNGVLYPLASESAAQSLYGTNWSTKIDDLSDAFFTDYSIGSELNGTIHPPGTVYQYENSSQYFYVTHKDGQVLARVMDEDQRSAYRIQVQYVQIIPGLFNYATGTSLHEAEELAKPVLLADEILDDLSEDITPEDALITVKPGELKNPLKAIYQTESLLYEFTIKGDSYHDVTLQKIIMEFFVDAGGEDADFLRNTDQDGTIERSVSNFVSNISLYEKESGSLITGLPNVPTTSASLSVNVPIAAGQSVTIQVKGAVIASGVEGIRISADVRPLLMEFSSSTAASIVVSANERLNGGSTPAVIVESFDNGTLTVSSTTSIGDSIFYFDQTPTIFNLSFHAEGEGFTVNKFSLQMTTRGDDFLGIKDVQITYNDKQGVAQTIPADQTTTRYDFFGLGLFVAANSTVTIPVIVRPVTLTDDFSNSRIQLEFIQDEFAAISESTSKFFEQSDFLHADRLVDETIQSPLLIFRDAKLSFRKDADSPSGNANRFNSLTVLKFTVEAERNDAKIEQFNFKLKTSDLNYEGQNNDMLEGLLRLDPSEIGSLWIIDSEGKEIQLQGQTKNFTFFNPQLGPITDITYESQNKDYGLFTYDFGTNPYTILVGVPRTFVFKLNTDTISIENSSTLQVELLGDQQSSAVSEGNFLWDDGTGITANGYLLPGLPMNGGQLSFSRLTIFNP